MRVTFNWASILFRLLHLLRPILRNGLFIFISRPHLVLKKLFQRKQARHQEALKKGYAHNSRRTKLASPGLSAAIHSLAFSSSGERSLANEASYDCSLCSPSHLASIAMIFLVAVVSPLLCRLRLTQMCPTRDANLLQPKPLHYRTPGPDAHITV